MLFIDDVKGINIATHHGECFHLGFAQAPLNRCSIADFDFIEGYVG